MRRTFKTLIFIRVCFNFSLFFLIGLSTPLIAGTQNPIFFHRMGVKEGLSSNEITCFAQTPDGFFWIGTKQGLNRYDGTRFKYYFTEKNIESSDIKNITISSKGVMWVGTLNGLYYYQHKKDKFIPVSKNGGLNYSLSVTKVCEDKHQVLWVGTNAGLFCIMPESDSLTPPPPFLSDYPPMLMQESITDIVTDNQDYLYVSTKQHNLYKVHLSTQQVTLLCTDIPINVLCLLSSDTLLIGTNKRGLLFWDTKDNQVRRFPIPQTTHKLHRFAIQDIMKDQYGNFWLATEGVGVWYFQHLPTGWGLDTYSYNFKSSIHSIAGSTINAIGEDSQGNLWFGSSWRGISVTTNPVNSDMTFLEPLCYYDVPAILSISQTKNKIWLGSDGNGLFSYDKRTKKLQPPNNDTKEIQYIEIMKKSGNGGFWIGRYLKGLSWFNPTTQKSKSFSLPELQTDKYNIRDIVEDPSGNLWLGLWGGGLKYLSIYNNNIKNFIPNKDNPHSLSDENVISLLQEDNGDLWISTFGGGVCLLKHGTQKFKRFPSVPQDSTTLSCNKTLALLKDSHGYLWISTWGAGLNRLNLKTHCIERFNISDKITGNTVVSMLEDDIGRIWFGSKQGISMYQYTANTFFNFPDLSGSYHINSAYKDDEGKLYFGHTQGVTAFQPRTLNVPHFKVPVKITGIKLFNISLEIAEKDILNLSPSKESHLFLKHNQNVITFEFSALCYPLAKNYHYSVKLDNFDEVWRDIGGATQMTFTNLPSGDYTFRVKTKHFLGDWQTQEDVIHFTVIAPFWQSRTAYLIYGLSLMGLLYLIFLWIRTRHKLKLELALHQRDDKLHKTKMKFLTTISHEFRTPITLILSCIRHFSKQENLLPSSIRRFLIPIQQHGNHLLHLTEELLHVRKLDVEGIQLDIQEKEMIGFIHCIFSSFESLATEKHIDYQWSCTDEHIIAWFDEQQLRKGIYNLLFNAFKFTPDGGKVKLQVLVETEFISIIVQNSGKVIATKDLSKIFHRFYQKESEHLSDGFGLGLSITKEVVELHRGKISVTSDQDKGTVFTIRLPKLNGIYEKKDPVPTVHNDSTIAVNKNISILVIEDNQEMREYIRQLLIPYFEVEVACNGVEGFDKAYHLLPDIILSDIMMPKLDGVSLSQKLRGNLNTSHISILLLTAKASDEAQIAGFRSGIDGYITKPFNEELLLIRIEQLINNRKLVQEKLRLQVFGIKNDPHPSIDDQFIDSLMSIVKKNLLNDDLSVEKISQTLGLSYSVFYKKVKQITGISPKEFITDYRLNKAATLLTKTNLTISQVCYDVGLSDPKYFTNLFKRKFGMTPSDYKIQHRKAN